AITLAIAPGGQGAVGTAVIQGILGYAGAGIPAWRDGTLQIVTGWLGASRLQIGPLPPRRAVPVETFDAELLGPRHRVSGEVTFRAALESRVEQIAVEFLARGRQRGWFANLPRLAPALARLRGLTRLGLSDRGGMQVSVAGRDAAGARVRRDWSLVAERGHGPYVPILPAAAAIKAIAENRIGRGAKLASDALTLEEIEREMRRYSLSVSPRHGLGP
ncbi:MAG: saccharopine dehydrogenase, partial [Pseudomonadota bacterium]